MALGTNDVGDTGEAFFDNTKNVDYELFEKYEDGELEELERAAFEERLRIDSVFAKEWEWYQVMKKSASLVAKERARTKLAEIEKELEREGFFEKKNIDNSGVIKLKSSLYSKFLLFALLLTLILIVVLLLIYKPYYNNKEYIPPPAASNVLPLDSLAKDSSIKSSVVIVLDSTAFSKLDSNFHVYTAAEDKVSGGEYISGHDIISMERNSIKDSTSQSFLKNKKIQITLFVYLLFFFGGTLYFVILSKKRSKIYKATNSLK